MERCLYAALMRNVDAYYAGTLSYEDFGKAQRAAWDAIDAAGSKARSNILRALREGHPGCLDTSEPA